MPENFFSLQPWNANIISESQCVGAGLPLFTELPRRLILGNPGAGSDDSRKPGFRYYRRRAGLLSPFNVLHLSCFATLCTAAYRSFTDQHIKPPTSEKWALGGGVVHEVERFGNR